MSCIYPLLGVEVFQHLMTEYSTNFCSDRKCRQ